MLRGFLKLVLAGAIGLDYLAAHQNPDGGWGDTDRSYSNIATTMLVRAAFHLAGQAEASCPAAPSGTALAVRAP